MSLDIFLTVVSFVLIGLLSVVFGSNVRGEQMSFAAGIVGAACIFLSLVLTLFVIVL